MTPDQFFTPLNGQSLLYPSQSEIYRGQCVQSVLLWLKATGTTPPIYGSAYQYFTNGIPGYDKIAKGQPILEGDIIVWGSNFPPSGGNGHIDVASADGTIASFSAWDSNWVPLKLAHILHNGSDNNYIAGYLRKGGTVVDDNITKRAYLVSEDRDLDSEHGGQAVYDYWRGRPVTELLDALYKDNETFRYKANNYDKVLAEVGQNQVNKASILTYLTNNLK